MAEQEIELTEAKSMEQAAVISMVNVFLHGLDLEYCQALVKKLHEQAGRQEGLAVLLPRHPQVGNDLLRSQAIALDHLVQYIQYLKACDELKKQLKHELTVQDSIAKLFI